jgi:hypothetical protein
MLPEAGIASFVYRVVSDLVKYVLGKNQKLTPSQVLERRAKWKVEFEAKIAQRRSEGLRTDVYVRDVARLDAYPGIDAKVKGISAWFRVGLMGTYHKGIMLGLGWHGLVEDSSAMKYRLENQNRRESDVITTILIGYVPYEFVESVDWDGDNITGLPQVYCHFSGTNREPYERLAYCQKKDLDGFPYYVELGSYESIRKASKPAATLKSA